MRDVGPCAACVFCGLSRRVRWPPVAAGFLAGQRLDQQLIFGLSIWPPGACGGDVGLAGACLAPCGAGRRLRVTAALGHAGRTNAVDDLGDQAVEGSPPWACALVVDAGLQRQGMQQRRPCCPCKGNCRPSGAAANPALAAKAFSATTFGRRKWSPSPDEDRRMGDFFASGMPALIIFSISSAFIAHLGKGS